MTANPYLLGAEALAGKRRLGDYDSSAVLETASNGTSSLRPFRVPQPVERPAVLEGRVLQSPLPGITDAAWTEFALAMKTQEPSAVSASNEIGMFAIRPRRLADLGLMTNVDRGRRSASGRMAWLGDWVSPLSQEKFLGSPRLQYKAFIASMKRYVDGLQTGAVSLPKGGLPPDMTLSGVLALLHRCGPNGLMTWSDAGRRFPATIALFEAANGLF